ncbi:MAG: hypothetical protein ACOYM3_01235 [Terrimicrobiaceae bacterium]
MTELFNFNISPDQKTKLIRRAALMTANTGKRITMSDLLRSALDQVINSPIEETDSPTKSPSIKFTPLPRVARAINQAHLNSGKPVNDVVNEMLVELLQSEGVSL